MRLYRFTNPITNSVCLEIGYEQFYPGKIYQEKALHRLTNEEIERWFEYVGDLPSDEIPTTVREVAHFCQTWIQFFSSPIGKDLVSPTAIFHPQSDNGVNRAVLLSLWYAIEKMPDAPALTVPKTEIQRFHVGSDAGAAMSVFKQFRDWALEAVKSTAEPAAEPAAVAPAEAQVEQAGITWPEVAEKLKRLQSQGEPFTSQHKLAEQLGCSSGTINRAIKKTPSLQRWAKREGSAPRAQSLNDYVTDKIPQQREADPADDATLRSLIEEADEETRGWLNTLSAEQLREYADDPDSHPRILGRKP